MVDIEVWLTAASAGLIAVTAPLFLRPLLLRVGVIDTPNHRSSHSKPTVRGGGIAQLLALSTSPIILTVGLSSEPSSLAALLTIGAGVSVGLVGLVEDLWGLRTSARAGLQLLIGAIYGALLSTHWESNWFWLPISTLAFAAYVNFANFMDGINGITSLHGFVAGGAFAFIGWQGNVAWMVTSGLVVSAAFIAFLPWNLASPGMFLGDVGSYLLGGSLAALAIGGIAGGISPIAAISPLSIYLADTLTTLLRRAFRGEPIFEAHRSHTYQRLTNTGLSHLQVSGIVAAMTAVASTVGIVHLLGLFPWWLAGLAIGALCTVYVLLPKFRGEALKPHTHNDLKDIVLPEPTAPRPEWKPRHWAVIGASGFIGSAVSQYLRRADYEVAEIKAPRVLLNPQLSDGARVREIAAAHPETEKLMHQLMDVDVVVNAAGSASPDGNADESLYGANALLPAIVAIASQRANASRVVHLSSAAVQGNRDVLDASPKVQPFSPYSRSKALGERSFLSVEPGFTDGAVDLIVIRATSVQGHGRRTTASLQRLATSFFSSVAAPGNQPTVVSSLQGLVTFVHCVGTYPSAQARIRLQPWEGLSTSDVLSLAGGRPPKKLPVWFCRSVLSVGRMIGAAAPRIAGVVRRVEVTWFGQKQELDGLDITDPSWLRETLAGSRKRSDV